MISIVDIGLCNVGSVRNMLRRIGVLAEIVDSPGGLAAGNAIILPGVGHFSEAMKRMRQTGFDEAVSEAALDQAKPILGICLGMQLLAETSEEGQSEGLGLLPATFVKFDPAEMEERLPVPHMGWNTVDVQKAHPLFDQMAESARFYFVHSYYAITKDPDINLTKTRYGVDFVSAYAKDHIMGVQFHPEKSHKFGMKLLQNFAALSPAKSPVNA
jgi:glutamine amidotransferase